MYLLSLGEGSKGCVHGDWSGAVMSCGFLLFCAPDWSRCWLRLRRKFDKCQNIFKTKKKNVFICESTGSVLSWTWWHVVENINIFFVCFFHTVFFGYAD